MTDHKCLFSPIDEYLGTCCIRLGASGECGAASCPRTSAEASSFGCYLISDNRIVVQKPHHKHTQHGCASALLLNSHTLTVFDLHANCLRRSNPTSLLKSSNERLQFCWSGKKEGLFFICFPPDVFCPSVLFQTQNWLQNFVISRLRGPSPSYVRRRTGLKVFLSSVDVREAVRSATVRTVL